GSLTYPYYTYEYHRNANSFFQTSALEYGVKLLMAYYGDVNFGARGGFDMTLKETVTFIDDFKWFLKDYGIINIGRKGGGEVAGVADNLVLMSTLFQYQSNGCDSDKVCMETPELTEFVIGLMTAVSIKDFFTETMLDYCASELDEHNRIAPDCFRRNFINVMRTKMPIEDGGKAISEFMPLLDNYMEDMVKNLPEGSPPTESEDYMTFITETENFTRSCTYYDKEKTDEVFLKANDAFAVFTGLLNVESTLLRFDLDQNNTIDAKNIDGKNEVYNAYKTTYKGALIAMVSDKFKSPVLGKFLAKPVFEYLVKYGDIPDMKKGKSILKFIKIIFRKYKKGNITRATVATILKVIGQQSENAALHPYKCEECFRDPTVKYLPEGDPWE
ncbi:MAG: hypothetical protein HON90_18235, partial [Halobacteriovoraceae bacterium]|nr:hypothetical protein [Halobacteriovoraceae bacterium]